MPSHTFRQGNGVCGLQSKLFSLSEMQRTAKDSALAGARALVKTSQVKVVIFIFIQSQTKLLLLSIPPKYLILMYYLDFKINFVIFNHIFFFHQKFVNSKKIIWIDKKQYWKWIDWIDESMKNCKWPIINKIKWTAKTSILLISSFKTLRHLLFYFKTLLL